MFSSRLRIAVLASGRGSNLAALIAACDAGRLPADIVMVGSDKTNAGALQIATSAGIATISLDPSRYPNRRDFDLALFEQIATSEADLLVLAGYMRIIDTAVVSPWVGRMINIHPSLLPKYRGLHTHRRAIAAGDTEHGASVHYVTAELDGGPIIAQARLAILKDDDEQSLATRLLPLEHHLLPAVVAYIASGRLTLANDHVLLDGLPLCAPLEWRNERLCNDNN